MFDQHQADTLLALYEKMLKTAQENNWDALETLLLQSREIRQQAQTHPQPPPATDAAVRQLESTIQRILALDQSIRLHVGPARDSIKKLLSGAVRDHNLLKAYHQV